MKKFVGMMVEEVKAELVAQGYEFEEYPQTEDEYGVLLVGGGEWSDHWCLEVEDDVVVDAYFEEME